MNAIWQFLQTSMMLFSGPELFSEGRFVIISKEDPSDSDPMEINEVDILYPSKGNQSIVLHRCSMYAFFAWFVFALHRLPCVQITVVDQHQLLSPGRFIPARICN